MKYIKIFMLLLWSTTLLFSEASTDNNQTVNEEEVYDEYSYPPHACYQFSKKDFDVTLNLSEDIIVGRIGNIDESSQLYLKFSASQDMPYGAYFECTNAKAENYECLAPYNIGKMQVNMKDESMSIHIDFAQISENSEPIIHHIKSKEKTFSKGIGTPCYVSTEPQINIEDVKKGSHKEKLLQSINIQDVIIYDLAYHNDLVIAVGESNSLAMREMQTYEENYESIILRSTDAGKSWQMLGDKRDIPNQSVIIIDEKRIVVAASMEGAGGSVYVSSNGGNSWRETYSDGMIKSLKLVDKELVLTDVVETTWKSKDGGESWKEQTVISEQNSTELTDDEENVSLSKGEGDSIAVLTIPEYRVDYETNTLIMQYIKNDCNCKIFSLSLTYNQSNKRKGILGLYWSLGIESQITVINKDKLSLFNAMKGKEEIYTRDVTSKDLFLHGGSKIQQTKNGYFTSSCDTLRQYFNKDGYLVRLEYKEKSYTMHYKDKKISKVMEKIKGKPHPYLSFSHNYEGPSVRYHHTKERKIITFLKNTEGTLSSILDGNQHIFHYGYSYDNKKLDNVEYIPESGPLLKFDYSGNDETIVYDFRQYKNGSIKEKTYLHYSKGTEHTCVVNTMTKYMKSDAIESVQNNMDMYHFSYDDATRKKLLRTEYNSKIYGFDEMDRVNYYSQWGKETSLSYHPFGKMAYSTVKDGNQTREYTYNYTKDASHYLEKMETPDGTVKMKYNEKGQVKELIIDKYHLYYEYKQSINPTKIIVVGKGEIRITYDDNHNIENSKTVLYDKNITEQKIALDVSQSMALLLKRVTEGSIKNYPKWIW